MSNFFNDEDLAQPQQAKADSFFDDEDIADTTPEDMAADIPQEINNGQTTTNQEDVDLAGLEKQNTTGNYFGLDTGRRVSKEKIAELAKKYNVEPSAIEAHAVRLGATYPDAEKSEKAMAQLYRAGDNLLGNLPSTYVKKMHGDQGELALDELRESIKSPGSSKVADFLTTMASPIKGPQVARGAGQVIVDGATQAGAYGLGNSESGNEVADTTNSASVGGLGAAVIQKLMKATAKGGAKILGRGDDVSEHYLQNPDKINNPDLTFENVKAKVDEPVGNIRGAVEKTDFETAGAKSALNSHKIELKEKYMQEGATAEAALRRAELELRNFTTDRVSYHKDQGRAAKEAVITASEKYKSLEASLKEAEKSATQSTKDSIKSAMDQARAEYADALAAIKKPTLPEDIAPRIKDSLKAARTDVSKGSSESFDILAKSGQKLDIAPLRQFLTGKTSPEILMGNEVPQTVTPELRVLRKYAKLLDKSGLEQDPREAKRLVQMIQQDLKGAYAGNAGAYKNKDTRVLDEFESVVQDMLKNPKLDVGTEFSEKMSEVAKNTGMTNAASKIFGKKDPLPALYSLQNPSNAQKVQILDELSAKYDPEISRGIKQFWEESAQVKSPAHRREIWAQTMGNLKDPVTGSKVDVTKLQQHLRTPSTLPARLNSSPEASALKEAESKASQFTPDYIRSKAAEESASSAQSKALQDAQDGVLPYEPKYLRGAMDNELNESSQMAAFNSSKSAQELAQAEAGKLGKWGNSSDSEDLIRQVMNKSDKKPNFDEQAIMRYLDEKSGQNLTGEIGDLKVKQAFAGGGPNGSRLVNLGRSAGKAAAGTIGEVVGGIAGASVDYSTGKAAKMMLDLYRKTKDPAAKAFALQAHNIVQAVAGSTNPNKVKYEQALNKAAERGPQAVVAVNAMIAKQDPAYAEEMGSVP